VLQCVAVCCSVLQCVAVCCSTHLFDTLEVGGVVFDFSPHAIVAPVCHQYGVPRVRSCGSCHTCEWVMSPVWVRPVTNMSESCHMCACKFHMLSSRLSAINMQYPVSAPVGHVTQVSESCHQCECFLSHMWVSHVTCVNENMGWLRLVGSLKL